MPARAAITERADDGTYSGEWQVKLGPTTASYRGTIRVEEADAATHTATLNARGTDKRGQGGATAKVVNRLTAEEGGTRIDATTDFTITGRLARFGRSGMVQDISNRLLGEFADCLQSSLKGGGAPAPAGASSAAVKAEAVPARSDGGPEALVTPPAEPPAAQAAETPAAPPAEAPIAPPAAPPRPAFQPQPSTPPLDAGSLVGSVVLDRVKQPPVLGGILAVVLLLAVLLRRRR